MDKAIYDFVVVGAGSAGCVIAGNLSAAGYSVLLLESGPDKNNFWVRTPLGYGHSMFNRRVNWMYYSEPEPGLHGRKIFVPRGRLVGGSSAINAMVYMRGTPVDFQDWAAAGNPEWDWEHVLSSYKRMENHCVADPEWHGLEGPLRVSNRQEEAASICQSFFEAAQSLQYRITDDLNGANNEAMGYYHHTIADGERMSAARAWLEPARSRVGFKLEPRAHVTQMNLEGQQVTGVTYFKDGNRHEVRARREVVLSAGAINSPQILMLSGIGPEQHLQQHKIPVRWSLPAVGRHLQDHFSYDLHYMSKVPTWNQGTSRLA